MQKRYKTKIIYALPLLLMLSHGLGFCSSSSSGPATLTHSPRKRKASTGLASAELSKTTIQAFHKRIISAEPGYIFAEQMNLHRYFQTNSVPFDQAKTILDSFSHESTPLPKDSSKKTHLLRRAFLQISLSTWMKKAIFLLRETPGFQKTFSTFIKTLGRTSNRGYIWEMRKAYRLTKQGETVIAMQKTMKVMKALTYMDIVSVKGKTARFIECKDITWGSKYLDVLSLIKQFHKQKTITAIHNILKDDPDFVVDPLLLGVTARHEVHFRRPVPTRARDLLEKYNITYIEGEPEPPRSFISRAFTGLFSLVGLS